MYYRLLYIVATVLVFFSLALGQTDRDEQYLSNDKYWYATGIAEKKIGSDYRAKARTRAFAQIATQIWSSFDIDQLSNLYIKNKIAEETFLEVIQNNIKGVVIEFDVEDVEKVLDKKIYRHTVRLSKKKYFKNRVEKRNTAIIKSGSILNNLDSFPSKSAINNLNDITEMLLPYTYNGETLTYEPLNYQLDSGEIVDLFAHTKSLARNYLDRITLKHSIEEYPLINISDNFSFNIQIYDRVTGQSLSNFEIIDKNTKKEKKIFSNNKGIITVNGKISNRSKFLYIIDYQSVFPDFTIFPLGKEEYLIEEVIFQKAQSPSFNFTYHKNSKKLPKTTLDILQNDLKEKLYREYDAVFNTNLDSNYTIVMNISYDECKKNKQGRYVCSLSVIYDLLNHRNDEIESFSITGIKGISISSKNDALIKASSKINELIREGDYGIFAKFSKAIRSF